MAEPGTAAVDDSARDHANARRSVRNYVQDAGLQLRLGAYFVAVAAALSLALGWQVWRAYAEASKVVALSDPRPDVIAAMLAAEDRARIVWMAVILCGALVCLLGLAVIVTHRIAGPAQVIAHQCRAVAEGSLARPRPLRRGDQLVAVADEVGAMVDALRAREEQERAALEDAASALAGSSGAPARAREIVERLAAAKARRLGT